MQENNFEKRVQQQMEDFKLRPSDAVWEKVEEELRKKKKRRVVFVIFLLAGLSLLSYSGYFLLHNSKQNLVEQNSTPTNKKEPVNNDQPAPATKNENTKVKETVDTDQLTLKTKKATDEEKTIGVPNSNSTTTTTADLNKKPTTIKEKAKPATNDDPAIVNQKTPRERNIVLKKQDKKTTKPTVDKNQLVITRNTKNKNNTGITQKPVTAPEADQPGKEEISKPIEDKTDIDNKLTDVAKKPTGDINSTNQADLAASDQNKTDNADVKKDSVAKEDVAATTNEETKPATPKKKKIPAISFGVELSYGISSDRDKLSIGGGQKSMMDVQYSSPQFNSAGPAPTAIYSLPPSSVGDGTAFRVGVVAEMKLTKRSTVSSGLRYAYFSNKIKVGTYKDTSVSFTNRLSQGVNTSAIYRGFQEKEFVNRFHFIQLPLQYELQLNKGLKLPISWNIGGSLSYLVSTNALIYDSSSGGIYYHDNSAFDKLHFNLNTGFSFRFGSKNKIQWSLGPELSLGMNRLMKNDYTPKQYLLYGGLTGRVIFGKKK
jgi:flagellar basal body-associated protein FliL